MEKKQRAALLPYTAQLLVYASSAMAATIAMMSISLTIRITRPCHFYFTVLIDNIAPMLDNRFHMSIGHDPSSLIIRNRTIAVIYRLMSCRSDRSRIMKISKGTSAT